MELPPDYGKNIQTFTTALVAHQVAIAAALVLAVRDKPDAKQQLIDVEAKLVTDSFTSLALGPVPQAVAEEYRKHLSAVFARALGNLAGSPS